MGERTTSELALTGPALDAALARFGHASFRPGQREAIETLLEVGALLLVAPTGGGKSLTYQLPASLLPGTTLVVSPLIALMQDQVMALDAVGVAATFLASTLDREETLGRMRAVADGGVSLVYVAPERLAFPGFRSLLADLECPLVAIDEAHCISEWGHDFRPEYLQLGELVADLAAPHVLACTATATPVVRDEIVGRLGLPPDTPQRVQGFARPNLALRAREAGSAAARRAALDAALAEALGAPAAGRGTAIVYSPTRRLAEEEARRLEGRGWRAAGYHAGMPGPRRDAVQRGFADGGLEVVVATNAFGMGIDRPDVRAVVHLGCPSSLEAYYQEVGRAGRDGERALGLLLFSSGDLPLRRRLLESPIEGRAPSAEVVEHKWALFLELVRFAEGGSCRHDAILRYFGDEAETLSGCGICDVCEQLGEPDAEADREEVSLVVRKALSAVARVHGRFGLGAATALLRGVDDARLARSGLDRTPTFGALRERSEAWLQRLMRRLVAAGWVDFAGDDRPVVVLTEAGAGVMRGEREAQILLPPEAVGAAVRAGGGRRRRAAAADAPGGADAALMAALREHRLRVARSRGVPPYVVAHDRTLIDIATRKPASAGELLECHGVGAARLQRYGDGLLEVVRRYVGGLG